MEETFDLHFHSISEPSSIPTEKYFLNFEYLIFDENVN